MPGMSGRHQPLPKLPSHPSHRPRSTNTPEHPSSGPPPSTSGGSSSAGSSRGCCSPPKSTTPTRGQGGAAPRAKLVFDHTDVPNYLEQRRANMKTSPESLNAERPASNVAVRSPPKQSPPASNFAAPTRLKQPASNIAAPTRQKTPPP
eukprot:3455407-Prymnesium_polylepis.1